eukprot:1245004-Pleurochrysis_carterae.AAC.1
MTDPYAGIVLELLRCSAKTAVASMQQWPLQCELENSQILARIDGTSWSSCNCIGHFGIKGHRTTPDTHTDSSFLCLLRLRLALLQQALPIAAQISQSWRRAYELLRCNRRGGARPTMIMRLK